MAAGAGHGAGKTTTPMLALPAELLERIYSLLHDPDDRARYRLVNTRCARADGCACTRFSKAWHCWFAAAVDLLCSSGSMDAMSRGGCGFARCRCCAAARAALISAEPQHPCFLELALQHSYPLRHLSTADLPSCDLKSYLAKVQAVCKDVCSATADAPKATGHCTPEREPCHTQCTARSETCLLERRPAA
jgi:hypothetical protein